MSEKSLQININSVDDAKAVIQNLQRIKEAYDAHACTSIETCIAESIVTPTVKILAGAFPWCVEYRKHVKPFEGNVFFELPHYLPPGRVRDEPLKEQPKLPKPNRYVTDEVVEARKSGKSAPLVQVQPAGVS